MHISVLCDTLPQLEAALELAGEHPGACSEIGIEAMTFPEERYEQIVKSCHDAGCACRLALPYIFRNRAERWLDANRILIAEAGFDGYLIRSLAEFSAVREILDVQLTGGVFASSRADIHTASPASSVLPAQFPVIKADYNLYAMNTASKRVLKELGADMLTAPLELNERELHTLDISDMELIVYGHIPMMISAQCIKKSLGCCEKTEIVYIKDRTGKSIPVETVCKACYNINYNIVPLSMIGMKERILRLSPEAVRIHLTIEDGAQSSSILKAYVDTFSDTRSSENRLKAADRSTVRGGNGGSHRADTEPVPEYTRGHFSRGVE